VLTKKAAVEVRNDPSLASFRIAIPRCYAAAMTLTRIALPSLTTCYAHGSGMRSLSTTLYLAADVGVPTDVEPSGTALENPYVYDSVARELKAMAREGLLQVVSESRRQDAAEARIDRISFVRLR
jgi:hypothetical protein